MNERRYSVTNLSHWQRAIDELMLPLRYSVADPNKFEATIEAQAIGGIRMFNVWAQPHQLTRSQDLIERSADPVYTISAQLSGNSIVEQHGRTSELRPGDLSVYDSSGPWTRTFLEDSHTFVIMFPQQLIALPPRALAQISGVRIAGDEGFGRILSGVLRSVSADLASVTGRVGLSVTKSIVDMVTAAFSQTLEVVTPHGSFTELELVVRIRESMMAKLSDPDLKPATIAAAHYISVRKLHAVFSAEGTTVSAWIRERRLEMSRRDLANPAISDSIAQVSQNWGFTDSTHFSKLFRDAYGLSPREYRQQIAAKGDVH